MSAALPHRAILLLNGFETHDVRRLVLSRPEGLRLRPGQALMVAVDEPAWRDRPRPFTPTGLPGDLALELVVKVYRERGGVTARLETLEPGARLLLSEPYGGGAYRGPGLFVAAGSGITPFLALLRDLARRGALAGHRLVYVNRTPADVIAEKELRHLLGPEAVFLCTREGAPGCRAGRPDRAFWEGLLARPGWGEGPVYLCGPPAFVTAVRADLEALGRGAEALAF